MGIKYLKVTWIPQFFFISPLLSTHIQFRILRVQFDESADEERYMRKVLVCHPPPHKKMIQNGTKWLNRSTPTHKKQDTCLWNRNTCTSDPSSYFTYQACDRFYNFIVQFTRKSFLGRICSGRYDKDLHTIFWTSPNPTTPQTPTPKKYKYTLLQR